MGGRPFFSAFALILASACATLPNVPHPKLTLLSSVSRHGELEPCGCSSNAQGGFTREANLLKKLKSGLGPYHLSVNVGTTFAPVLPDTLAHEREAYSLKAHYVVRSLNEIGLDVLSPSAADFSLGLDTLLTLKREAKFHFVSGNLLSVDGKPLFEQSVEYVLAGHRVVITSVTHFAWSKGWKIDPRVTVGRPVDALRSLLERLGHPDFVILLSDLPEYERNQLVALFPEIRMVIGAEESPHPQRLEQMGDNTVTLNLESRAREIGRTSLTLGPRGLSFFNPQYAQYLSAQRNWRAAKIAELMSRLEPSDRVTIGELKSYLDKTLRVPLRPAENQLEYSSEVIPLDGSLDTGPNGLTAIIEEYKEALRTSALRR